MNTMIALGAQLTAKDCIGRTPLHFLAQVDSTGEVMAQVLGKEELKDAYNVDAMTHAGVTPLMIAVKLNHNGVVKQLLDCGANPFLKDQLGAEAKDYSVTLIQ